MSGLGWGWVPGTLWGPAWSFLARRRWAPRRLGRAPAARHVESAAPWAPRSPWRFTTNRQPAGAATVSDVGDAAGHILAHVGRIDPASASTQASTVVMNAGPTNAGRAPEHRVDRAGRLPARRHRSFVGAPSRHVRGSSRAASLRRRNIARRPAPSRRPRAGGGGVQPYRTKKRRNSGRRSTPPSVRRLAADEPRR